LPVSVKSFYANGDSSGTVTSTYSAKGYLISQESTNANGLLVETRSGKAKGDLWRITITNAQNGEVLAFEDRAYSSEGDLLVRTLLSPREVPESAEENQWREGKKTQWMIKLGANLAVQSRTSYTYDASGNNVRREVFDSGNKLLYTMDLQYDAAGHLTSSKTMDTANNLAEQVNYTWKGSQKLKEETVKPLLRTLEYTYTDDTTAPTGINSSVRGKLVEKQVLAYTWIKYTHRIANKE
jgi:hypothetical protein